MTAQTATTTPAVGALAETIRLANIVTDVAVTIGALDVAPIALTVENFRPDYFGVMVQIDGTDVVSVDTIASELPGEWEPDGGRSVAYQRVGMVRFGGERVKMRVFTTRPTATDGGAR